MAALSAALRQFSYGFQFDRPSLSMHKMKSACDQIRRDSANVTPTLGRMSEEQLKLAISKLKNNQALSRKQLKTICYGQLDVFKDNQEDKELFDRFLRQIQKQINGFMMKALLQGYLLSYKPNSYISNKLHYLLTKYSSYFNQKDQNRIDKFGFLDDKPAKKLAFMVIRAQSLDYSDLFREAKLNRSGEGRGLLVELFKEICLQAQLGAKPDSLNWFLNYCLDGNEIIYKEHIEYYALALLGPWRKTTPDKQTQKVIQHFLIDQFGDPRVKAGRWVRVSEELKSVLFQWLVSQSLDLMLEVLSASNDTGHWRERKPFWKTYIDAGVVDEAWVVFGSQAYWKAKQMEREEKIPKGGYGQISGGSSQRNHSVLLLRMGDFIISEWTHDGKVRCFNIADNRAPKLYRPEYNADKIRDDLGIFAISHYSNWQRRVRAELTKVTGHRV